MPTQRVHLAEAIAGVPYSVSHPCVVEVDGAARTVMIAETDHCCVGFRRADGWLRARGLQREGTVGRAHARLCDARELVAVALEHLAADQGCEECTPRSPRCARWRVAPSG